MSLISDLKAIAEAIPGELETLVEGAVNATLAALKPIMQNLLTGLEQDVITNAGDPAALVATAATLATQALPLAIAASIKATGLDLLTAASNALAGHPAVQAAQAAAVAATLPAQGT